MTNLRDLAKQQLVQLVLAPAIGQLAVMVCDDYTIKLVSSALKIHEINQHGVGAVLNIQFNRERMQNTTAIYFISPTRASIEAVIKDYAGKKPQYGKAHLFTCGSKIYTD
jgi:syntaxin-binding protein 1